MRIAPVSLALLVALASTTPVAHAEVHVGGDNQCNVESDYDLTVDDRSVILTRDSGQPKAIVMRQGKLFVDDRWLSLTPADSRRIADFERGVRKALPEAQVIGREAAQIAFIALSEVATGFSSDPEATRAKLAKARKQLDMWMARSVTATRFDGRDLGEGVENVVRDVLPTLVGDIVGGAVSAALSGDTARLERMENLDATIEAQVAPRAQRLEKRADQLCQQLLALDRLDDALEVRVDGRPLNMMDASVERSDSNNN